MKRESSMKNKTMTEAEATEWVYAQDESDPSLPQDELEAAFAALYGRPADDEDRQSGLWSLCCAATQYRCPFSYERATGSRRSQSQGRL